MQRLRSCATIVAEPVPARTRRDNGAMTAPSPRTDEPGPLFRKLQPGDHAPWFVQRSTSSPHYAFDTVAGRYLLLCFFGTTTHASARQRLDWVAQQRPMFDDSKLAFYGVTVDPGDEANERLKAQLPGIRHFWDLDQRVSRLYGALPMTATPGAQEPFRPLWVLLNPNLQVRQVVTFSEDGSDLATLQQALAALPEVDRFAGMEMHAPVIMLPDVFDAALCRTLIGEYEREQREISGFARQRDGRTVQLKDASHKVRRDHLIDDAGLRQQIQSSIKGRIVPAIQRVHSFEATRIERYLVACYDSQDKAHFRPHRDNTTTGTAHRRFAVSINLNDEFDGGELMFPEFGTRRYKPPRGAAVVFSCSLLHAVEPVRGGRRYAFLPFLYDAAAAALREANLASVDLAYSGEAGAG